MQKRDKRILLCVTKKEKELLEKASAKNFQTVPELIRNASREYAKEILKNNN